MGGKEALGMGSSGAAAGTAILPGWGTAIGGIGGTIAGLFMGNDKPKPTVRYMPEKEAFENTPASSWFRPEGGGSFWYAQGEKGVARPDDQYVGGIRQQGQESRQRYEAMLDRYMPYALGEESIAREQARRALEAGQRAVASRAASAPGHWNPAVQRASLYAQGDIGAQVAGESAAAAMQERESAMRNYLAATGAMRGQDIQSQLAEQSWWGRQSQHDLAVAELKQRYLALGYHDKQATDRALQEYQALWSGQGLGYSQMEQQKALADREHDMRLWLGTMKSAGDLGQTFGLGKGDIGGNTGDDYGGPRSGTPGDLIDPWADD